MKLRGLWGRVVCGALQNGYADDDPLKDSGWRGRLAAWLTGQPL